MSEDIKRLQEISDVVIITYQKDYTNKRYTLDWLEKNGIEPNGICFLKDKTLLHTTYLLDDNDWNFCGSNADIGVLITAPYNVDKDLNDILEASNCKAMIRCESLHDFVQQFVREEVRR